MSEENKAPLLLPAPDHESSGAGGSLQLDVNGSGVKLDELGPMVVNSDGTLSRIANWVNMTEEEKKRTLRVLVARNKVRLATIKQSNGSEGAEAESLTLAKDS